MYYGDGSVYEGEWFNDLKNGQGMLRLGIYTQHFYAIYHLNPVAMHHDVPYFIILLCQMPDNFTCQGESAPTQCMG
jgi:hypothetical protein